MDQKNTPAQEVAERAAESIPALQAAAAAVGLQDHQRMLRDHARRVRDSHRAGMKAAGLDDMAPDAESSDAKEDAMGDIIISGDITNTYLPAPPSSAAQQPTFPGASTPPSSAQMITPSSAQLIPTNCTSGGLSNLAKAAIVGASLMSGGIGGAIPLVANLLLNKPAPVVQPAPAKPQGYEIRIVPDKES